MTSVEPHLGDSVQQDTACNHELYTVVARPFRCTTVCNCHKACAEGIATIISLSGIGSSADPRPLLEYDDAFWDRTLAVNLTAPYLLCKAMLPGMVARRWGRVINVASINSRIPTPHAAAYAASKHGLIGLTRALALEVARDGITVNAICPGPVHTVMNDRRVAYDARRRGVSFEEQERSLTPMGRRIEPDEVTPLAVYLAGDESRMMTGPGLNLDGGICMA
jgi:3-hydroxybutyrate dehydrogenase